MADDGPGLTEAERSRVLQRGARGDHERTRTAESHGLGLSIAAKVASVHGWQFSLTENTPHGLLAELTGPVRPY